MGLQPAWEPENAESLGLRLVFLLGEQLEATVQVQRQNGTEFRITFLPQPAPSSKEPDHQPV